MSPAAIMPGENTVKPEPRLTLQSQLGELARLWSWVEAQAAALGIPADTEFAIQLCLEEAISNVIRHGHGGQPNLAITVDCTTPAGIQEVVFAIEDHAPPFNPLAADEVPLPSSIDQLRPGGRGIRLLRKFAGNLAYQRLPGGNRLTIGFALPR